MRLLHDLRISTRLLIVYALFLLPVAALFHSVYVANDALVAFTRKEIRGALYAEALRQVMDSVARDADPAALARAADRVEAAERQHGDGMDTAAPAMGAVETLRAAGPGGSSAALYALQFLVARVADGSNLVLDSDLNSHYLVNALTVEVPDIVVRLEAVAGLTRGHVGRAELFPAERDAFQLQDAGFSPAMDGLETSMNLGFRGNGDGSVRAALAGHFDAARDALNTVLAALRAGALAGADDQAADSQLVAPALAAVSELSRAGNVELRRLLEARIDVFRRALAHDMLIALALFAVAVVFLVAAVQRGVVRPVVATARLMERLAAGDTALDVPGRKRRDEVGTMARAVEVFRQTAIGVAEARAAELRDAHRVAHVGIWRRDLIGGVLAVSDELHDLLGTDLQTFDLTPENVLPLVHPDDRAAAAAIIARARTGEAGELEFRLLRPDNKLVWLQLEINVEADSTGRAVAVRGVCQDVTERRAAAERIYRLAHYDSLTGLANRALLHERIAGAVARAQRKGGSLAVLCFNLDGFKAVNDLNGHAAGDVLLREVGARLGRGVRETDTVARLGGDEFVVLQDGPTQPTAAHALADRLLATLAEPYDLSGGAQASVTASVGVALFPGDGDGPEALLHNAETALYRAKGAGRNSSAFFRPEMDREARERQALERDLKHVAARGELALAWQPIAEAAAGGAGVLGFEVLLRWDRPGHGRVPPDQFIPVAESCGAIIDIGAWVLREACHEAARWAAPLLVAVNVSPVQAQRGEAFAEMVEQALASSGLDPSRLLLEVTEGVLIRESDRVLAALRRLKARGVRIALDDFGTGYSSLATLRAFPFDKLKIDRGFIAGVTEGGQDTAIVRAVLGLARGLGLPVVAEGVETEAQLAALRSEGCQEVQGWLIGRPAPIETFAGLTGALPPTVVAGTGTVGRKGQQRRRAPEYLQG